MHQTTTKTNKMNKAYVRRLVKKKAAEAEGRRCDPAIWEMLNPHAAGIDGHSEEMWVCVPGDRAEQNVRKYGA